MPLEEGSSFHPISSRNEVISTAKLIRGSFKILLVSMSVFEADREAVRGNQAGMARGIHGLPKISPRPAMPNPSKPCGQATTKTA
jgi:hypothetical protein